MPPRPASPCSRALRRQLTSSSDSVWISDSLLASVFERYCAVSHQTKRRTCNVPGPLESRRRLGKRQIGGLNALQNPSGLPEWSLPVLDLSKWNWEPPTPLSVRQERVQDAGHSSGWGAVFSPRRLAEWIHPNDGEVETQSAEVIKARVVVLKSHSPWGLLDEFQSLVHSRPLDDLVLACEILCNRLQNDADLVAMLVEDKFEVLDALDSVWAALEARFSGSSTTALGLFAQVYSSLLGSEFTTHTLEVQLCRRLLAQLAKIPASDELCELFQLAMRAITSTSLPDLEPHILAILDNFFVSWTQKAPSQRHIQLISDALAMAAPSALPIVPFLERAEAILLQQSCSPRQMYQARFAWLSVVARCSALTAKFRPKRLTALFGEHAMTAAISTRDICELLLAKWTATGRLQHPQRVRDVFTSLTGAGDPASFGALSYALYLSERHWQDQISRARLFLKAVGRLGEMPGSFNDLAQSLVAMEQNIHPRFLHKLIVLCNDHRVALRLHELSTKLPAPARKGYYDSAVWEKYLLRAAADKSTRAAEVCKILKLCEKNEQTASIAADLAQSFAQSDELGDRAALRYVMHCKTFLQRQGSSLPPKALDAIYRVVTRDLARGEWARSSRLRWLVNTVDRECGPEVAKKMEIMLRGWRNNVAVVKDRKQRQLEEAETEQDPGLHKLESSIRKGAIVSTDTHVRSETASF